MKIVEITTRRPSMSDTRTYEEFSKFLGEKPERLGVMAQLNPDLTASFLTEGLYNIYAKDAKKEKFSSVNSRLFEWDIEVNQVKRIEFAGAPIGDGNNGSAIIMAFKERYYEKYDIFRIEESRQLCQVIAKPNRKSDNYFEVMVQLIDPDYSSVLDANACGTGHFTRFISNAFPELSEEGYTKYQSNMEKHRNYITLHRVDDKFSALYANLEDVFVKVAGNNSKGDIKEKIYTMNTAEQALLENFMFVKNTGILFNKCNVDKNGKPTAFDPDTGQPIYIGDGMIPQIERFAPKYAYAKMSVNVFESVLNTMIQKSKSSTGNAFVYVCNERQWFQIQRTLRDYLSDWKTDGAFFYSGAAGGDVSVGATFTTYIYGGNQISFKVDKSLTLEYPDRGFGVCFDLTGDKAKGQPAMMAFTIRGMEFIKNTIAGVGGMDGRTSGPVSHRVTGSYMVMYGSSGVGVFNPYKNYIIEENI
jgi:hypothetical protein